MLEGFAVSGTKTLMDGDIPDGSGLNAHGGTHPWKLKAFKGRIWQESFCCFLSKYVPKLKCTLIVFNATYKHSSRISLRLYNSTYHPQTVLEPRLYKAPPIVAFNHALFQLFEFIYTNTNFFDE